MLLHLPRYFRTVTPRFEDFGFPLLERLPEGMVIRICITGVFSRLQFLVLHIPPDEISIIPIPEEWLTQLSTNVFHIAPTVATAPAVPGNVLIQGFFTP